MFSSTMTQEICNQVGKMYFIRAPFPDMSPSFHMTDYYSFKNSSLSFCPTSHLFFIHFSIYGRFLCPSPCLKYWHSLIFGLRSFSLPLLPLFCSQRRRSSIQSAKTRPGADYGSDHELLIVKFRLKLKKVGETTRLFRYDLNQIPYNYTVEVTNRFKGLDLIEFLEELWTGVCDIVQEAVIKTIPKKKKYKKAKWLSEEALKTAEKRREAKGKGEKERYTHLNA